MSTLTFPQHHRDVPGTTVYVSDDEIGVLWDGRGPVHVLDRDGAVSERFTPPRDSQELAVGDAPLDAFEGQVLAGAEKRLREVCAARKLSEKTVTALVDAVLEVEA